MAERNDEGGNKHPERQEDLTLTSFAFEPRPRMQHTPTTSLPPGFHDFSSTILRRNTGATKKQYTLEIPRRTGGGEEGAEGLLNQAERLQVEEEWQDVLKAALEETKKEAQQTVKKEINKMKTEIKDEMIKLMRELTIETNRAINANQNAQARPERREETRQQGSQIEIQHMEYEEWRRGTTSSSDSGQNPQDRRTRTSEGATPEATRSQGPRNTQTPIDKWSLKFDGNNRRTNVSDFIFQIEHLKAWNRTPWEEVVKEFHHLVEGRAREWFWTYIKMNGVPSWDELKIAIQQQFSSRTTDFEIMQMMMGRTQKPQETIDEYLHEMTRLRAQLKQPMSENEMVKILKRNIKESVGRTLYAMQIYSVDHLRAEYHGIELAFPNRPIIRQTPQNIHRPIFRQHVNEIENMVTEEINNNNNNNENIRRRRTPICWNCQNEGHTYMECEQPRNIFCYKCGKKDVITPKCPRCQAGNEARGTIPTSEPHSETQGQNYQARKQNPFRNQPRQT